MPARRILLNYFSLFTSLILAGCTRPTGGASRLNLQLPTAKALHAKGVSSAANSKYFVVVINVTGPGIDKPIFYQWQNDDARDLTPPSTVALDVPSGSARLVQALVLTEETTTAAGAFSASASNTLYYNDATIRVDEGANDVNLDLLIEGTNLISGGNISGRWVDAQGNGPTGHIYAYYQPTLASVPPMLLDKSSLALGGWFKVFSFGGANSFAGIAYKFEDGRDLFGHPVNAANLTGATDLGVSSGHALQIYQPDSCTKSTGTPMWNCQGQKGYSVYGFFGPGTNATSQICYSPSTPVNNLYAPDEATPLAWNSTMTSDTVNPHLIAGGTPGTTTLDGHCGTSQPTSAQYATWLALNEQDIGKNENRILGFDGAFEILGSSGNAITTSFASPMLGLQWTLLPGTTTAIDGVELFLLAGSNFSGNDRTVCEQLVSQYGFTDIGSVPNTGLAVNTSIDLSPFASVLATLNTGAGGTVVACPYHQNLLSKTYYEVFTQSGVQGISTATNFTLLFPGQPWSAGSAPGAVYPLYAGETPQVQVETLTSTNQPSPLAMNSGTSITANSGGLSFTTDFFGGTTASSFLTNLNLPGGVTAAQEINGGTFSHVQGLNPTGIDFWIYPNPSVISTVALYQVSERVMSTATCQPILTVESSFINYHGTQPFYGQAGSLTETLGPPPSAYDIFLNPDCTNPVAGALFTAGSPNQVLYAQPKTTTAGAVDLSYAGASLTAQPPLAIRGDAPGGANHLELVGPASFLTDQCQAFFVEMVDEFGLNVTNGGIAINIALSAGNSAFAFYSDPACASPALSVTMPAAARTQMIYVKVDHNAIANPALPMISSGLTVTAGAISGTFSAQALYHITH